jgi:hypothetical protein
MAVTPASRAGIRSCLGVNFDRPCEDRSDEAIQWRRLESLRLRRAMTTMQSNYSNQDTIGTR